MSIRAVSPPMRSSSAAMTAAEAKPPPEYPTKFLNYRTKTDLRLPFEGTMHAFWAGRDVQHNYHAAYPDQRFALDLLAIGQDQKTHRGDGTRNSQYLVWNRPLVAPAAGTVVEATDGILDNKPGVMNPDQAFGNHVIIDHGNGEFSFLAHLRKGTVAVHAGDKVDAGALLGRTGNSGNTSEPHLHYHLLNTAVPWKGDGLPAQFQHYEADGGYVERGEPGRFHAITHVGPPAAES